MTASTRSRLPDDFLRDVFARMPDSEYLLRCAGACRRWLRLIAKPAFLRRAGFLPEDAPNTSFLAGAFFQDTYLNSSPEVTWKGSECLPEFKRLYPWPGADWPLSFFVPNRGGLFNWALPLASRRGLLLVRILPLPLNWRKLHLVVCDPLLGRHRRVPPPPLDLSSKLRGRDVTGHAILPDADRRTYGGDQERRRRSAFKVVFTAENCNDRLLYAYSYSSATDIWSAPISCSKVSGLTMSGPRAGVVARGIVYWLYRDETHFYALGVSADATDVSLTKVPTQVDHDALRLQPPFPCIARGKLSFVIFDRRNNGVLDLWTKHDEDDDHGSEGQGGLARWARSNMMSQGAERIKVFAFAEGRGALLICDGENLFTLDLENKKMEPIRCTWGNKQLCDYGCDGYLSCTLCTYNRHVLYEMDWPSYILHLSDKVPFTW